MRSCLRIVAEKGRLPRITAHGALAARVTGPETVHLIGAAATPLGGDVIEVQVSVAAGARLVLRTVAASIALPGSSTVVSHSEWRFDVADGATLDVDPEPTIIAAAAEHHAKTIVQLTESSVVRIRERAQIGRAGEGEGRWSATLAADLAGRPLVRHRLEIGAGSPGDDVISAPRAAVGELVYPDIRPSEVRGIDGVRLPLALGGSLSTWQGSRLPADVATVVV
ncbi:urease accessory protein UreD [Antrihabitans sp. YC2-6]|uniref:urease accessory protein UreD n=1 Tax=Antrihabitans sp. YC2-6 TaxID=2799498 RepID=UPI0018F67D88|nr:urease accessory protein UreD [Antrihabitans sp. YC2-6]MBJ8348480.1 urease accessory protein UreD [Antrihabitans sp. YC2-6]